MKTKTINLYSFDELSDDAKETAKNWFRCAGSYDNFFAECVFDDAAAIADLMGIDLRMKRTNRGNYEPSIYYSGFSSQGDGACFESRYAYEKGSVKAVKSYAPKDKELARIATALEAIQKRYFYKLTASTKHSGHYYHEYCMTVDVDYSGDDTRDISEAETEVTELMRDFARWIYKQLESAYDYANSDDTVSENIRANEYEFLENGTIS